MRWAMILLLLGGALAGCIGDDEDPNESLRKAQAQVTEDTGAIQGVVTDVAIQPLDEATITLVELEMETTTEEDGSYAISNVPPGTYTLEATKEDHVPSSLTVTVEAQAASTLDFVLTPLSSQQAYTELFELNGYIECGQQVGWEFRDTTGPITKPVDDVANGSGLPQPGQQYGVTWFFLGIATCSLPNVAQENTTNDRFIHLFDLQPGAQTLLYDMSWSAGSPAGASLGPVIEIAGQSNNDDVTFLEEEGQSPILQRVDKDRFDEIQLHMQETCEEDSASAFCGINPDDGGWPLQHRVFTGWQCFSDQGGACGAFQQDFTVLMEVYYNEEAPPGASLGSGA